MSALDDLVAALEEPHSNSTSTSVRQPAALRQALQIAVELGLEPNANDATNQALRGVLDAFAQRLALDEHYAAHPGTRLALHEVAQALAVLDRSPLADLSDVLRQAESEVLQHKSDADADDVLLWAKSLLVHSRGCGRRQRVPA